MNEQPPEELFRVVYYYESVRSHLWFSKLKLARETAAKMKPAQAARVYRYVLAEEEK